MSQIKEWGLSVEDVEKKHLARKGKDEEEEREWNPIHIFIKFPNKRKIEGKWTLVGRKR